jgi:hypothetical protein
MLARIEGGAEEARPPALPFHLLVTEKPPVAVPQIEDIVAYRDAAWLVKRHAVTVLPSVASLEALRVFGRREQGTKPMTGFGDPIFAPERAPADQRTTKAKIAAKTRAYAEYWRGSGVDRAKLAEALAPLPDTAEELKAVAAKLGASLGDIHLGNRATETNVKRSRLADYRVVYFATHGLVAGDVQGLGEPSLALTLPKEPSDLDDGLLTASEVAQPVRIATFPTSTPFKPTELISHYHSRSSARALAAAQLLVPRGGIPAWHRRTDATHPRAARSRHSP